tara:strand:+ start:87 stop:980 length:894 start_codon:yes stop_codon:yes gene_type:complete
MNKILNTDLNTDIDVIIPVKERYLLLLNALKSIEHQTILPNKVFIIDDHSNEKIDNFKKYPFELILIRNEENKGPSFNCNLGALKSKAKYISILETDDLWLPTKLEKQFKEAEKNNLDLTYCNYFLGEKKNTQKFSSNNNEILDLLLNQWSCPNPSTFFLNRVSFLGLGGFDEKMFGSHDHDFWIRIASSNLKIDFSNEYLVKIEKYNPNQMSREYKSRIQSTNFFIAKHRKTIISHKGKAYFKHYSKELMSRALIPVLKKTIKDKKILSTLNLLKYFIFSKLFYKRIFGYLKKRYK